ncbi:MAG: OB-fold nucleic acid binding domain-containing protein, partial [Candidatus Omnitrophota bacterium]
STLPTLKDEEMVKIVGLITKVKNTITRKKQEKMAILMMEDLDAVIEVLVFPATYQKVSRYILSGTVVMLRGRLDIKESTPKIIAEDLFPFDEVYKLVKGIRIDLAGTKENIFESLKVLLKASTGTIPVYLHLDSPSKTRIQIIVGQELFVTVTDQLILDIENLVGDIRGSSRVSLVV